MMVCVFPFGIFTSWFCGWADDKWGTKAASVGCCIMLICSQLIMGFFCNNLVAMCIGTALLCGTLSAQNNTAMSIVQSKFGRFDFANGWTVFSMVYKGVHRRGSSGRLPADRLAGQLPLLHPRLRGFTVIALILQATLNTECVGRNELD